MESFEYSKSLRYKRRRQIVMRKIKIVTLGLAAGVPAFFFSGGVSNIVWASLVSAVICGLAGAAGEVFFE